MIEFENQTMRIPISVGLSTYKDAYPIENGFRRQMKAFTRVRMQVEIG